MSDDVQPGVRIDPELWRRFREDIEARKGAVRGHLKTELENAIRMYLNDDPRPDGKEIDARLTRIESHLGVAESDGGVDTIDAPEHTHAPTERPAPQASTEKKVRWLAECVLDTVAPTAREFNEIPVNKIKDVVKDEYGFRSDTAERYVERLITHFDLVDHLDVDGLLVTEDRRTELEEQKREQIREETEGEL